MKKRIIAATLAVMSAGAFAAPTPTDGDVPAAFAIYARNLVDFDMDSYCVDYDNIEKVVPEQHCYFASEGLVSLGNDSNSESVKARRNFTIYSKEGLRTQGRENIAQLHVFNDYLYSHRDEFYNEYVGQDLIGKCDYSQGWCLDIAPTTTIAKGNRYAYPSAYWPLAITNGRSGYGFSSSVKTVANKEVFDLNRNYKQVTVENGGTLVIHPGVYSVSNLEVKAGATVKFAEPGKKTIINASTMNWYVTKGSTDVVDQIKKAKGLNIHVLGTENVHVKNFAGTVYAPRAKVYVGDNPNTCTEAKATKFYGRIAADEVYVQPCVRFNAVMFKPVN